MLTAQELSEFGDHNFDHIDFDEEEECWMDTEDIDLWNDTTCLELLSVSILLDTIDLEENKKAKKRIINYHW